MTTLKAHFDGKVLVPDEAVDLPLNCPLEIHVRPINRSTNRTDSSQEGKSALQRLAELAKQLPCDPNAPADGAAQHDHYLYGTPKR